MDINWDEEPEQPSVQPDQPPATPAHEETLASAPAPAAPTTRRPMVDRHGFYVTYVSVLAAVLLVTAIAGVGFVFGHYVVKPSVSIGPSPYTRTSLPIGNGSGGFEIPNFGGSNGGFSPTFPTPSGGGSTTSDPAAAKIAKAVDPGLVDINTNISYQEASAAGTGMILTSNGYVLTNNHVIEGSTSITARDVETGKTYTAKVVGYDLDQDVALLKLEGASGLTTVSIGNSSDVTKNEQVVGIGNAEGAGGTPSFAAGTIVATDQTITADSEENPNGSETLNGLIEMNAAIEPGDSGGPLVNAAGKVIGMDTAAAEGGGNFGFSQTTAASQAYAIPINTAIAIEKQIKAGDASATVHIGETAILGIEVDAANPGFSGGISGEPSSNASGVTVGSIMAGTPAANSGLVAGDVITSFDGHTVTSTAQLSALEYSLKVGQSATIVYVTTTGTQVTTSFALVSGPPQ